MQWPELKSCSLAQPRHRLVEWKVPGAPAASAEFELYDYRTDPLETKNLAAEQPETVNRLRALLASHPEAKPQIPANQDDKPGARKRATDQKKR